MLITLKLTNWGDIIYAYNLFAESEKQFYE